MVGVVGERCCVRNSGATVVVEGVGDHACEYMTGGRVLVLGATGRNFAAGMSGGIAYVLDLNRNLVNTEMVDFEPMTDADYAEVQQLLTAHAQETDSAVAAQLLSDWSGQSQRFTKIMPRDFRRVLDAQARAEAEGRDVLDAVMEAARG